MNWVVLLALPAVNRMAATTFIDRAWDLTSRGTDTIKWRNMQISIEIDVHFAIGAISQTPREYE